MTAPILWAPGIFVLSAGNPHAHKIPRFRGGQGSWVFWTGGGGSADFIFMGVGIFLKFGGVLTSPKKYRAIWG